ncbi:MAG: hypothetical protein RMZ41_024780 [Nostoc sp. DedVER02]|nr:MULTISPECIES: hypothetical protein [unclassified Nostoc]MDZ7986593.1 hypothetical protein [Nostoc sp. DedVER02]MDZ8113980.1 hypothetical protein [Nostoc sp. DedVER01b]
MRQYSSVKARDAIYRHQDERLIVETAIYRVFALPNAQFKTK